MTNRTIFNAYNETKSRLFAANVEDYGFEARVIIRHITGFDNKKIMLNYNAVLTDLQQSELDRITEKRCGGEPLQYILGEWSFYGRTFKVGTGVLIPRADTETAVECALELIKELKNPKIADLCAGSGAIGITLAKEREDATVVLLEKYGEAAHYARENIELNGAKNASLVSGEVYKGDLSDKQFDLIISNPPYVRTGDIKMLQREVLREPQEALDGGEDGLKFYRAITENYKKAIAPGGFICFEVGIDEAKAVGEMLLAAGFSGVGSKADAGGVERVVFGTVK